MNTLTYKSIIGIISIFALFLLACQSGPQPDHPPNIRYGEDPCEECYMLINEERHASAYVSKQRQARRFDDIGCMLIYNNKHQEHVASFWVKDFNSHEWIRADEAVFVKSDSIQTPMGFGIIAAEDEKSAKDLLKKNQGKILQFSELLEIGEELSY